MNSCHFFTNENAFLVMWNKLRFTVLVWFVKNLKRKALLQLHCRFAFNHLGTNMYLMNEGFSMMLLKQVFDLFYFRVAG